MIERKIIIGIITSTEYIKLIQKFWDIKLLESIAAKRIARWCWEYYNKYQKAPGKDMEMIFFAKLKTGKLPKDIAEEISEEILPSLSQEFIKESFNIEALVDETKKYLSDRHLALHTETLEALRVTGQIEEAEKLAADYKPLGATSHNINDFIRNMRKIKQMNRPVPTMLMNPWLRAGETTIIYGPAGSGKSLLSILIAYVLGLERYQNKKSEIGEWQVRVPTGTLYIDGELGEQEMEDRVNKFEWLGKQLNLHAINIFSVPEYQLATEDSFYLSNRINQLKIIQWLKEHPTYKLVILDSASTLFGLEQENDNSEWNNKINPFLRDLRALGIANILLHHSGKDGKRGLRGASAMSAMAHNIFKLINHKDQNIDAGEAYFILSKDKQRAGGVTFKTFAMHFFQKENGKKTQWIVEKNYKTEK